MGRGRGGYTKIQTNYKDSGGWKVTDKGSIFVAERYIDMGYEAVFRQRHPEIHLKTCDLTIKTNDDKNFIKDIEVKMTTSTSPSQLAKNIKRAFAQVGSEGTVAIYLPNRKNSPDVIKYLNEGFQEAKRKISFTGDVEVWFNDKTRIVLK
jgi:hypothetical protein